MHLRIKRDVWLDNIKNLRRYILQCIPSEHRGHKQRRLWLDDVHVVVLRCWPSLYLLQNTVS